MTLKPITLNKYIAISTIECVLRAKLRNRICQGLDRQGQGQGLTSLTAVTTTVRFLFDSIASSARSPSQPQSVTALWPAPYCTACCLSSLPQTRQSSLETCIDDERQFKTAKRPQAPSDATFLKWFSAITSLFFVVGRKG